MFNLVVLVVNVLFVFFSVVGVVSLFYTLISSYLQSHKAQLMDSLLRKLGWVHVGGLSIFDYYVESTAQSKKDYTRVLEFKLLFGIGITLYADLPEDLLEQLRELEKSRSLMYTRDSVLSNYTKLVVWEGSSVVKALWAIRRIVTK